MKRPSFRFGEAAALIAVAPGQWRDDGAPSMGAASAYYVALSVTPATIILPAVTGWAFGARGARQFLSQIQGPVGYQGAQAFRDMVRGAGHSPASAVATGVGLVTVFAAASAAVTELRDDLDIIWRARAAACSTIRNLLNTLKDRLRSLALVVASGLFFPANTLRWCVLNDKNAKNIPMNGSITRCFGQ